MEKDDRMRIRTLIMDHTKGIQVDILKSPALYTAANLNQTSVGSHFACFPLLVIEHLHQAYNATCQHRFDPSNNPV